jgi:hypothetical protein
MALEVHKELRASDIGEIMSIDRQVLVMAFLAISLELLLWAREAVGVELEDELHRSRFTTMVTSRPKNSDVRPSLEDEITE